MKDRKSIITEDTIIEFDEEAFRINAENLLCELFIEYVNEKYGFALVERKI
ncbi:hypothetical protein KDN24_13195 [Bacillus sp. Bva_UNVM-123]|uniref:hypothetical protein n=1 Tax=Bacillus sp. Bva_UNVM-123 TaxID=2829798 RepID=UPI00391EE457